MGLLDTPDEEVLSGDAVSRQYALTFESKVYPTMKTGDSITVDGVGYVVLTVFAQDDGVFSIARLKK